MNRAQRRAAGRGHGPTARQAEPRDGRTWLRATAGARTERPCPVCDVDLDALERLPVGTTVRLICTCGMPPDLLGSLSW